MKKLILTIILVLAIILIALVNKCMAAEVTLNWKSNTETNLKEYRLYQTFEPSKYTYGTDSGNYVITIVVGIEALIIFVKDEDVDFLYWVLTAVNSYDLESGPSNEVCIEEPEPSSNDGDSSCFVLTVSKIRRSK